jgi:hypothetical protein
MIITQSKISASHWARLSKRHWETRKGSAVTAICKNSNKEEARKFINRKILYFDKNTEGQYTTEIVFKRLNAIVDNY